MLRMELPRNMTFEDVYQILLEINRESTKILLPTSIFLIVLGTVGFLGNSVSVYVFVAKMKRNLQNDLLVFLTVMSLITCVICIPRELTDVYSVFIYPSLVLCKVGRFANTFATAGQVFVLIALSVVRYRAVCLGRPVKVKSAYVISGLLVLTCSLSWIGAVVYGFRTAPTLIVGVMGRDCSVGDDVVNTSWPMAFNICLVGGFSALVVNTSFCYFRIWRTVNESNKAIAGHIRDGPETARTASENQQDKTYSTDLRSKGGGVGKKRKSVEHAISLTAFIITFTFIMSHTPFFLISIPRFWIKNLDVPTDKVLLNLINITVRCYFVSSTINPIIFLISNVEYKRQVKTMCFCIQE